MEFAIYSDLETVQPTYFRLRKDEDSIDICVVDANGDTVRKGVILTICPDGNIRRNVNAVQNVGLGVDADGGVIVL